MSEYQANNYLNSYTQNNALERAKWQAVLGHGRKPIKGRKAPSEAFKTLCGGVLSGICLFVPALVAVLYKIN